jgi:hypothetical protein
VTPSLPAFLLSLLQLLFLFSLFLTHQKLIHILYDVSYWKLQFLPLSPGPHPVLELPHWNIHWRITPATQTQHFPTKLIIPDLLLKSAATLTLKCAPGSPSSASSRSL